MTTRKQTTGISPKAADRRAAHVRQLLAAVSVLGVSLGMTQAQAADNANQGTMSSTNDQMGHKGQTHIKLDATQIKGETTQIKGNTSVQHKQPDGKANASFLKHNATNQLNPQPEPPNQQGK